MTDGCKGQVLIGSARGKKWKDDGSEVKGGLSGPDEVMTNFSTQRVEV